ncbi:MAG: amino acid permease [Candidatus Aminicenantes bacterium]|jgi:APA family basic amino acid/polyamine antiporter|nr:amino acid permease [Candidatus Aminicenantes bacterium]NLH75605.1 amino acid permease [Acidobacteriota bacterium]
MSHHEPTPPGTPLVRCLGTGSIISIVVGTMIGSGIFIVPATVAGQVRSPLLMLAVWIAGGIACMFGVLALAELAAAFSETGGIYVYLREIYGPMFGFLFGWTIFLVVDSGTIATLSVAFASKYLPHFVPIGPVAQKAVAVAFILFLLAINYFGVKRGALLQNLLTTLKFVALLGIIAVVFLSGKGDWGNLTAPASSGLGGGLVEAFGLALVAVLWAYKGFEVSTFNAGETKDPSRSLPIGLIAGCGIVTILYILANVAYLYVVPAAEMAKADRIAAAAMNVAVGPVGASVVSAIILFSILGAANGHVLTGPRVYYAMAKDGLFFKKMAAVHPKYHTPHVSLMVVGAWSIVLSLSGTFEQLLTYAVFGNWIFLGLAVVGVFVLRKKRPDLPRPYKTLGYPVTPVLFILAALFVIVNALVGSFRNSFAGLVIISLGIPAYLYWNRKRSRARQAG